MTSLNSSVAQTETTYSENKITYNLHKLIHNQILPILKILSPS